MDKIKELFGGREISPVVLFSSLLIIPVLVFVMGIFSRKNRFVLKGRTVLITGGSQGMGRALGKLCAQKGANVIIVARNVDKLKAALEYIKAAATNPDTQRFHFISSDLTNSNSSVKLIEDATQWNNNTPPDIVWANAGSAYPHLFIDTPIDTLRSQMDIDYWAAAYLAHATLKSWTQESSDAKEAGAYKTALPRHFIITSSLTAFVGLAGYGTYSPAKAALRNLSDTLRSEINIYNGARANAKDPLRIPEIKNHIVFPAGILTPGFEEENKHKHPVTVILEEDDKPQTEDEVATIAIKALEHGDYLITTVFLGYLMKVAALAGSPRNGWGIVDTLTSGLAALIWCFVGPDLEGKVFKWGKQHYKKE